MKNRLLDDYYTTGQLLVVRGALIYAAPKQPRFPAAKPKRPSPKPFRAGKPKTAAPANPK